MDDITIYPKLPQKLPNDTLIELSNATQNMYFDQTAVEHYAFFNAQILYLRNPLYVTWKYENGGNTIMSEPYMVYPETNRIESIGIKIPINISFMTKQIKTVVLVIFPCFGQDLFCMQFYRNPTLQIECDAWITEIAEKFSNMVNNSIAVNFAITIIQTSSVKSLGELKAMSSNSFGLFLNRYNAEFSDIYASQLYFAINC